MRGKFASVYAVVASTALLAQSAPAAGNPVATQPAAGPIKNDTGKRVCRDVTPTGSRMSKRVCRTAEEWQLDAERAERDISEANRTIRDNGCGFQCPR